ncbi:M48 family metalloprotease [Desulfococcus sp.]|uniref:M48 family metalloprotease n=1 Tax=Desulfococcus sp. TaxID=2025834 RepID=UPI003592F78F
MLITGCEETDVGMAIQAGADALRAATLKDEDVKRLAVEVARQSDLKHSVAPPDHPHARRLHRLIGGGEEYGGHGFNCKVYLSPEVNAFAMADGTIRIYSGLMDMLDDRELLFVVGHEMGHVTAKHIKKKIMLAYAGSAVRKAVASQQNEVGAIARSAVGAFSETLLNARFSQQEEREADDYGVLYLENRGHDRQPAVSALIKLAAAGNDHSFLSSHPAPEARAKRILENGYDPRETTESSVLERLWRRLKGVWSSARLYFSGII